VSAKDKNTGKEQSIVIKASSGLSQEEVDKMVRDAKDNAAEDRAFQELASLRNQADALIHSVRSSLDNLGNNLSTGDKDTINGLITELETEMKASDSDSIRSKMQAIEGALNGIVSQHQAAGASQNQQAQSGDANAAPNKDSDNDVVDADFEEA
jgi:molecular chaperone DnaK